MSLLRTYLCLLLAAGGAAVWGQHTPITSQYLQNGLVINPAYAGSNDALTTSLSYRNQWTGMDGAPTTQTLSLHTPLKDRPLTVGALLVNDRIAVTSTTELRGALAYRMRTGKGKLQLGLGFGALLVQANWTRLALQDPNDVQFASDARSGVLPTFSAGAYYYDKKWFVGLSVPAFVTHRKDNDRERWTTQHRIGSYQPMLLAGRIYKIDRHVKIKPSILLRYMQGSGLQADLSMALILRNKLLVGGSYRTADAAVAMFQVLPSSQWRIGYSYDMGLSRLRSVHHGSHELMVQYSFGYRVRVYDPRFF